MGTVQDHQDGITGLIAEAVLEYFGRQTRTAHSQDNYVTHAISLGFFSKLAQCLNLMLHRLGHLEPAQTVGQLRNRVGGPKRRILFPQPAAELLRLPTLEPPTD